MTSVPPEKTRESHNEEGEQLTLLLIEYSGKLSSLCDEIESYRARKKSRFLFVSIFFSLVILVCICAVTFLLGNISEIRLSHQPFLVLLMSAIMVYLIIYVSLLLCASVLRFLYLLFPTDLKEKRLVREAKILSKKLEKVIRVISQIQDHSPKDISSRIEMDFRLTDAELVLERSLLYVAQK
jgi:hypothetical protein